MWAWRGGTQWSQVGGHAVRAVLRAEALARQLARPSAARLAARAPFLRTCIRRLA